MKFGRFAAGAALVIGSVAIGSAATQGSGPPEGVSAPTAQTEPSRGTWPGGPKPALDAASGELVDGGYVFVPITPFRTYDSRENFPGRIFVDEEQYFTVLTDMFDETMIFEEAVAVTYNITVTGTSGGGGYLAVFPADIFWPGNASVNWTADGTTQGNGGTTTIGFLDAPGQLSVQMGAANPAASTDYIVDITGYYK